MLTFAVSWLRTNLHSLQHDLYYLIYFTFALGYLAVVVRRSGVALRDVLRRNLRWSCAVGVLVGAAVVRIVDPAQASRLGLLARPLSDRATGRSGWR